MLRLLLLLALFFGLPALSYAHEHQDVSQDSAIDSVVDHNNCDDDCEDCDCCCEDCDCDCDGVDCNCNEDGNCCCEDDCDCGEDEDCDCCDDEENGGAEV